MIQVDTDFSGFWKILTILAALVFVIWMHQVSGAVLWLLAAFYGWESHENYQLAKAYRRLGGHMRRAVK